MDDFNIWNFIYILADKIKTTNKLDSNFTIKSAIIIGLFQVLALNSRCK